MKYLILSDIHGSLPRLEQALNFFRYQQCDMMCILGDILNYGPRNSIPQGINPKGIAERLNAMADSIVAVRGNCDSEVDQMMLHFPMQADYAILIDEGTRLFLTHGHIYNVDHRPPSGYDAIIYGHTHIWQLEEMDDGRVLCNTGSITFPKNGNVPTVCTYEHGILSVYELKAKPEECRLLKSINVKSIRKE